MTLPFDFTYGKKTCNRLAPPGDDDFFAGVDFLEEARQVGFRRWMVITGTCSSLANLECTCKRRPRRCAAGAIRRSPNRCGRRRRE